MPQIIQLPTHIANLIAAGEVVERPASVVKELLENAVDAGATQITLEIRNGGMTFLRVTDNGCGMSAEDAPTAFLRHATSKLRTAEDLAAIETMGFRGEALAAIASVSRIDLMTKTANGLSGTSLRLEGGRLLERSEVGCPKGTTIIVRDLFFNTPARMKFMKSDTVESGRVAAAVQLQALAHPEVAFTYLRDGKQLLSTDGRGDLKAAVYSIYGRDAARMVPVDSRWEGYHLTGFVGLPTDARPSRGLQTFFVNNRPVRSKLLVSALEEAYRNQLMVARFPTCVLHLSLPANAVDVNVHPAKTEVKFLSEKAVFDCLHYGVLSALNRQPDRPEVRFSGQKPPEKAPIPAQNTPFSGQKPLIPTKPDPNFFRTMDAAEFRKANPLPKAPPQAEQRKTAPLREPIQVPVSQPPLVLPPLPETPKVPAKAEVTKVPEPPAPEAPVQEALPMPEVQPWTYIGELYHSFILVEQGEEAFLIDKHAAHERILFEKLRADPEAISSQTLLTPVPVQMSPEYASALLSEAAMLEDLGFEAEEFGDNTLLLRRIPMDLSLADAGAVLEAMADALLSGRREKSATVRDELLHTVACKAAAKAGQRSDPVALKALAQQVMTTPSLKYCPHGRPICITLSKRQLEKQFRRTT